MQRFVLRLIPSLKLQGVLRISFGLQNSCHDVEVLANSITQPERLEKGLLKEFIKTKTQLVYGEEQLCFYLFYELTAKDRFPENFGINR